MKIVRFNQSTAHTNAAKTSRAHEYPIGDGDIDCAFVHVDGEYPGGGKFARNTISKEVLFVVKGGGAVELKNGKNDVEESAKAHKFGQFDVIFIDAGEIYRITTDAEGASFAISCTPPWSPDQAESVD